MFTGITTDIGTVRSAEQRGDLRLVIACGYDMATVELGASIACSGVCFTVVDKGDDWFAVDVSSDAEGGSIRLGLSAPAGLEHYLAPKGSITLDGVSLTVNEVRAAEGGATHFTVNIIPHTAEKTTFAKVAAGRQLNVEIDVIARYLERMLAARSHPAA
jgi:riboflavin synthase